MHHATSAARNDSRTAADVGRRPGAPRRAERARHRRGVDGSGGGGSSRAHGAASGIASRGRHPDGVPAILRHGEPLRRDQRALAGREPAGAEREPAGWCARDASARHGGTAGRVLRARRAVQACGELEALAIALSARRPREPGARIACGSAALAPRAASCARGRGRGARSRDVVRGLGSTAHGAAPRPRPRAAGGRAHGRRPRRPAPRRAGGSNA